MKITEIVGKLPSTSSVRGVTINFADDIRMMAPDDVKAEIREVIKFHSVQLGMAHVTFRRGDLHYVAFGAAQITVIDSRRIYILPVGKDAVGRDDCVPVVCPVAAESIGYVEDDIDYVNHLAATNAANAAYDELIVGAVTTH